MTHRASSNRCPARGLQQGRPENTWARVILSSIDQEIHLMCSQFDPAGTFSHMIFFSEITLPKSVALEASIPFLQDLVVAIDWLFAPLREDLRCCTTFWSPAEVRTTPGVDVRKSGSEYSLYCINPIPHPCSTVCSEGSTYLRVWSKYKYAELHEWNPQVTA
jgi:hypothetical protein